MSTRYFVLSGLWNTDEVPGTVGHPPSAIVNSSPGANIDYKSCQHEMRKGCDCSHCKKMFSEEKGQTT